MPEEYEAAGIPMRERGARLAECLDDLEALWSTDPAEYDGSHWAVPRTRTELRPTRSPRPPLYVGGFAGAARRRGASRADGWMRPIHAVSGEFGPRTSIAAPLGRIRKLAEEQRRDPGGIGDVLRV